MSFLCCCSKKKKAELLKVIENKNVEITELQGQVNEKQGDINNLHSKKDTFENELKNAKLEIWKLRNELKEQQEKDMKQNETLTKNEKTIRELESELQEKTSIITRLNERILELESDPPTMELETPDAPKQKSKRQGIIVERDFDNLDAKKTPKNKEDRKFLLKAIESNDLLRRLTREQIDQIIDYMVAVEYPKGHTLIKEGDDGDRFYILQKGECNVFKENKRISTIKEGNGFGEIAIVLGGKRTATVAAADNVKVWYILRSTFKKFTREAIEHRDEQIVELMKSCEKLYITDRFALLRMAQVVNEEEFTSGEYIVRQGEIGKIFYIIKSGEVDVTQNNPIASDENAETWIRALKSRDYFGEGALREKNNRRGANVIAKTAKVVCFTLDEESFNQLIGQAAEGWKDETVALPSPTVSPRVSLTELSLQDFTFLSVLGSGGFGRVELVRKKGSNDTFALKCMKKIHIVETRQEEHVYSEKKIMLRCRSNFIVRLFRTFKNNRYVYMLMEPCLGGELWKHLRDSNKFSDNRTKFYTACVVEALSYLHKRRILYRDLKPENLLLDSRGYVKIVDFGFAKELDIGERTWTFCGTPQYVPPEIILNQGHDMSVDYWALGILIFEFLTGNPPFDSVDQMKTYRLIIKGIDAIEFPVSIKKPAHNLIRRLCKDHPAERLGNLKGGIDDIRGHRWFSGFDWEGLRNGKLKPDFIPVVSGNDDTRNFDQFNRRLSQEKVPSELSGWDVNF